jgi:hypothetical protein
MMSDLSEPRELVEKILLETRPIPWVALSMGGCGILTRALLWRDSYGGGHDEHYMGARSSALTFAHRVLSAIGLSAPHEQGFTPQILVDAATALNDGPTHVALYCTTWQCVPEGLEICSVGSNSVLLFEESGIQEVIVPHSINTLLQSQGRGQVSDSRGRIATHALGGTHGCGVDEVRVARIPFVSTTTIAIIEDRRLVDAIIERVVPRDELPSFIEAWTPSGKRIRTSVLISL